MCLKGHFARHRNLDEVDSNNGPDPLWPSTEFREFANKWMLEHTTSSPNFSQSNALVGAAVKSPKKLYSKLQYAQMRMFDF